MSINWLEPDVPVPYAIGYISLPPINRKWYKRYPEPQLVKYYPEIDDMDVDFLRMQDVKTIRNNKTIGDKTDRIQLGEATSTEIKCASMSFQLGPSIAEANIIPLERVPNLLEAVLKSYGE